MVPFILLVYGVFIILTGTHPVHETGMAIQGGIFIGAALSMIFERLYRRFAQKKTPETMNPEDHDRSS